MFKQFDGNLKHIQRKVVGVLKESEFPFLVSKLNGISRVTFNIKFFLKDHKADFPVRVVVNENSTQQKVVSSFLQGTLSVLDARSLLSLHCSEDLITELRPFHGRPCSIFTMYIKDHYYSLDSKTSLSRVSQFLENNVVTFQSQSGIAASDFLRMLELHLQATVVKYDDKNFIQKQGVCTASAVAPVLSEIYLCSLDLLHGFIQNGSPDDVLTGHYVDILVCTIDPSLSASLESFVHEGASRAKFQLKGRKTITCSF